MYHDVLAFLPKCLRAESICSTFHCRDVSEHFPDIATYQSNGYIYEIKNKRIISCLHVKGHKIISLTVYYLYENDAHKWYYLALTETKTLLIIKKCDTDLLVTRSYNNVQEFKVFDFKSVGYPQIELCFSECVKLLKISDSSETPQETSHIYNNKSKFNHCFCANSLEERLQLVNAYIKELIDEKTEIKKSITVESITSGENVKLAQENPVGVLSRCKGNVSSRLAVVTMWQKCIGQFYIFGVRIINKSAITFRDLQLELNEKNVKAFKYCFFQIPDHNKWPSRANASIHPRQNILLVGAFQMPVLIFEASLSIECFLRSSECESNLKICKLSVNAEDFMEQQKHEFASVDDVLALLTTHEERKLIVQTQTEEKELLKLVLLQLGFKTSTHVIPNFFYHQSMGTGLALDQVSAHPVIRWILLVYISDSSALYLLVNSLYNALPEYTTIGICNGSCGPDFKYNF